MYRVFIIVLFFIKPIIGMERKENVRGQLPQVLPLCVENNYTTIFSATDLVECLPYMVNQWTQNIFTFDDIITLKRVNKFLYASLDWKKASFCSDGKSKKVFSFLENMLKNSAYYAPIVLSIFHKQKNEQVGEIAERYGISAEVVKSMRDMDIINVYAFRYVPSKIIQIYHEESAREAIEKNDAIKLGYLLSHGSFDIFFPYSRNYDLLSVVCGLCATIPEFKKEHIFELLITKNSDKLNLPSRRGIFPAQRVIQYGTADMLNFLIDKKASIDVKDNKGRTLLHYAVQYNKEEMLNLLLAHEAKIDEVDYLERTPLHYIGKYGNLPLLIILDIYLSQYFLLDMPHKRNYLNFLQKQDRYKRTALHYACVGNYSTIVGYVLSIEKDQKRRKTFFDINLPDNKGNRLLHIAAKCGSFECLKKILQWKNVGINALNKAGQSALHMAVLGNYYSKNSKNKPYVSCINLLLKKGIDIQLQDTFGNKAIDYALKNKAIIELLKTIT